VAVDVHSGVRQCPGELGHPARPVVDLGEERLALNEDVAHLRQDVPGRVVVRRREDHVAELAEAAAADRAEVDASVREALREDREGAGFVRELDDELLRHRILLDWGVGRVILRGAAPQRDPSRRMAP
jgi:hypothetical protein